MEECIALFQRLRVQPRLLSQHLPVETNEVCQLIDNDCEAISGTAKVAATRLFGSMFALCYCLKKLTKNLVYTSQGLSAGTQAIFSKLVQRRFGDV